MAPPAETSVSWPKRIAATATTAAAIMIPGSAPLPSHYCHIEPVTYADPSAVRMGHAWEIPQTYPVAVMAVMEGQSEWFENDVYVKMPAKSFKAHAKIVSVSKGKPSRISADDTMV
jgi:hypothetical protein